MEFPSRKTIHDVVNILSFWDFQSFFKPNPNHSFEKWCLEVSRNTPLKISHGCTKIVVYFGNDDWVIKIPFSGKREYCRDEAQNYILARQRGLSKYFAPCYFYGVIDDIPIYLQRRVEKDDEQIQEDCYAYAYNETSQEEDESDEDYVDRVDSYIENDMEDYETVCAIIGYQPELLGFISMLGINDLHRGNFGYLDGRPVVFDYSGY